MCESCPEGNTSFYLPDEGGGILYLLYLCILVLYRKLQALHGLQGLLGCEGDTILDAFCGTGTSCIASIMLKRDYVGVEISKEYHEIALKRVEYFRRKRAA